MAYKLFPIVETINFPYVTILMHSEVKQETLLFEGRDSEGDGNRLELSDKRVRLSRFEFGSSRIVSIMLEHVTSCEMTKKSSPIWALLSFICGILVLFELYNGPISGYKTLLIPILNTYIDTYTLLGWTVSAALVFFGIYMLSKKETLIIASPSSKIVIFKTDGFGTSLLDIMDSVELRRSS